MVKVLVDIVILIIAVIPLRNFSIGFFVALCSRIFFPPYVRFIAGPISFAVNDFILLFLIISFVYHNYYRILANISFSRKLFIYLLFSYATSFILIFLSSDRTPFDYQISSFFKTFIQDSLYTFFAYYAFKSFDEKRLTFLFSVAFVAGIYGIAVYMTKINPYIDSLSTLYMGENRFEFFLEQVRGGLIGRTSGTLDHPLTWGQVWGILISIYFIYKSKIINKIIFYSFPVIAFLNILFSGSRAAIVVLCCILIFYLISLGKKKLLLYILLSVCAIFVSAFLLRNNQYAEGIVKYLEAGVFFWDNSYSEAAGINGSNTSMRISQLEKTLEIASQNPIGGLGFSSVGYFGASSFDDMYGFESIVFKKIVEQGFLGLIFYCISLIIFVRWAFKFIEKTDRMKWAGFYVSYFISIIFTGIQNSWALFFFLAFLPLSKHYQKSTHV
ncbi:MAG: O-antigen ligase family protein [Fibrobacter sp.]|nr:O-antigen ligase family protein [Fibrobacter sp.]